MNPEIIYEDKHIIVCIKPPTFPVQSDLTGDYDMVTYLKDYMKKEKNYESPYIALVHRIDRPVGGLVVFAKNPKAAADLSKQLQDRVFKKYYFAIVEGQPEAGRYVDYLKKRMKDNLSRVVEPSTPNAKEAILNFEVLKSITKDSQTLSLVKISLETGRHHQIRVQFASHGFPLWGDTKYNPNFQDKKGWYQIALFASKIEFKHPSKKEMVCFEAKTSEHPFELF